MAADGWVEEKAVHGGRSVVPALHLPAVADEEGRMRLGRVPTVRLLNIRLPAELEEKIDGWQRASRLSRSDVVRWVLTIAPDDLFEDVGVPSPTLTAIQQSLARQQRALTELLVNLKDQAAEARERASALHQQARTRGHADAEGEP
jgi:hypothetical protein